jgi:hypothetical protein
MIDIRIALRNLILSDPDIISMVGERCYPSILPQGATYPSIVQNLISEDNHMHLRGSSHLARARIQIDCWATTADESVRLSNFVMEKIQGFSGIVLSNNSPPVDDVRVQGIFAELARDGYDSTNKIFTRQRDFMIWYVDSDFLLTEGGEVLITEGGGPIEEE